MTLKTAPETPNPDSLTCSSSSREAHRALDCHWKKQTKKKKKKRSSRRVQRFCVFASRAAAMAWLQRVIIRNGGSNLVSAITLPRSNPHSSRFFSKSTPYVVKVGIPEFLNGIGNGVESHVAKLESELGDFQKLLVTRTLKLKKLGIPCKHRKLILKYTHKYRLGLWRPRAEPIKA